LNWRNLYGAGTHDDVGWKQLSEAQMHTELLREIAKKEPLRIGIGTLPP
jgi:hypothetical protein